MVHDIINYVGLPASYIEFCILDSDVLQKKERESDEEWRAKILIQSLNLKQYINYAKKWNTRFCIGLREQVEDSVLEIIRRLWKWRLARVRGEQLNQLVCLFHVARSSRKSRVLKT